MILVFSIEEEHDSFRGYKGAYKKAIEVLKCCATSPKLISSMRVSVTSDKIHQIDNMVDIEFLSLFQKQKNNTDTITEKIIANKIHFCVLLIHTLIIIALLY